MFVIVTFAGLQQVCLVGVEALEYSKLMSIIIVV